jgi:hypothetical protein
MHTKHFVIPLLGLLAAAALAEPAVAQTADSELTQPGTYPLFNDHQVNAGPHGLRRGRVAVQAAPASPASAAPLPAPTLSPVPAAASAHKHGPEYFVAGDYIYAGTINNEFSPGNNRAPSWTGRAAAEGPIGKFAAMAEVDFRTWQYPHFFGPVTAIGGNGSTVVPFFNAHDTDGDVRLGAGLRYPRVFIGASYLQRFNNYGYANQQGFGFGIEKLPDFDNKLFSVFGSFYYYPQIGSGTALQYSMYRYEAGIEVHPLPQAPVFVEAGYLGDIGNTKLNSPGSFHHQGGFAGMGLHL